MQEVVSKYIEVSSKYIKERGFSDLQCAVTALFAAYAYGLINTDQLLITLRSWRIPLQEILPLPLKLFLLPPFMGATVFALGYTKNHLNKRDLIELYNNGKLWQTIKNRINHYPHANIIATIGSFAEFFIIKTAEETIIGRQDARESFSFMKYISFVAALSAATQYFIVDGQSLIDAIQQGWPEFDARLRGKRRNWAAVIGAYVAAILGSLTMASLAYMSAKYIFYNHFGNQYLAKAIADLVSIIIGLIYGCLDFTLYGLELVLFVIKQLKKGRFTHPALNSFSRIVKFVLALNGFFAMAIVGYGTVTKLFFPDKTTPLWAIPFFILLAFITGTEIYVTECLRLIKLNGTIENDADENSSDDIVEASPPSYRLAHFLNECLRAFYSTIVSGSAYATLTILFNLPENIYTASAALIPYAAINTLTLIHDKQTESNESYIDHKYFMSISLMLWLGASLAALLWKINLTSQYGVSENETNKTLFIMGLLTAIIATIASAPLCAVTKSIWENIKPFLRVPDCCFFNQAREIELRTDEKLPLLAAPVFVNSQKR